MYHYTRKMRLTKSQREERKQKLRKIGEIVYSVFIDDPNKYGFDVREGQQDMACEIIDAITADKHFAVEAGVGIGKSYAYLVPLLLYSQMFNQPVVVATSTIALQEQLLSDVQHLQKILNTNRDVILAKGQAHYVCKKRAYEYTVNPEAPMSNEIKACIKAGAQERKDFNFLIPQRIWEKINVFRFNMFACASCKDKCLYHSIRSCLQYMNGIILCNQDFLTAHLQQQSLMQTGLFSEEVELIVIDEAHNLENKVRSATTGYLSRSTVVNMIQAASKEVPAVDRQHVQMIVEQAGTAVQAFYSHLRDQVKQQINEAVQDMKYADRFFFRKSNTAMSLLKVMTQKLRDLSAAVELQISRADRPVSNTSASDALDNLVLSLSDVLGNFDDYLVWIEQKGSHLNLVYCPKNTKQTIRKLFFNNDVQVILTSATLTTARRGKLENQYSYFIESTGFPVNKNAALSEPKPSPFPYDEHAMIYYCSDLPHPTKTHEAFIKQGTERLVDILSISHGKALILFTAKTDMEEVYRALLEKELPYKILIQQTGASQEGVLQEFEDNTDSVLLGTGAYWEGISIEGKSLSNLVIFRLPFPVPDPIIEYKTSVSDDPLTKVLVPEMIMKLKQGIGRLIRNFTDTGIVSIIDPRLSDTSSSSYRNIVWEALPIHNRTDDIQKLQDFYKSLPVAVPDE